MRRGYALLFSRVSAPGCPGCFHDRLYSCSRGTLSDLPGLVHASPSGSRRQAADDSDESFLRHGGAAALFHVPLPGDPAGRVLRNRNPGDGMLRSHDAASKVLSPVRSEKLLVSSTIPASIASASAFLTSSVSSSSWRISLTSSQADDAYGSMNPSAAF